MKRKLKILLIVSLFFTGLINCNASTKTYDRNELKNYGVNKNWKITSKNKNNVLNTPAVDASEKIYDFDDVLTDEEEEILKGKISEFITTTNMDMVIVIPSFYYTSDSQNEDYAADFYDYNDFGMEFKKNSGVLFLRNNNKNDPYFNIYTFGNAQLYFSYNRLENILDSIYNDIKSQNYLEGFSRYIDMMITDYNSGIPSEMREYKVNNKGFLYKTYQVPWIIVSLSAAGITAIVLIILISRNKMVMKASEATEYLNKNSVKVNERKDKFITSHTSSYRISSDDSDGGFGGGFGGGFSSRGGSSGGGHSSGGGRHG